MAASFNALMGLSGHSTPDLKVLVTGDWESVRTVVDVGGTGALLAEILRARPEIHGTLVDLPRTVARAGSILQEASSVERVRTVGQSFFDLQKQVKRLLRQARDADAVLRPRVVFLEDLNGEGMKRNRKIALLVRQEGKRLRRGERWLARKGQRNSPLRSRNRMPEMAYPSIPW